jgi:hypothetical protein
MTVEIMVFKEYQMNPTCHQQGLMHWVGQIYMVIYGFLVGKQQVSLKNVHSQIRICLAGLMNDLWVYDGKFWTWMAGSTLPNQLGSYGEKGVASSSNVPGGREAAVCWRDNDGNLWLFSGSGFSENLPG